tara:strand:- start:771 stop:1454 length:684 start_codon:yes stop_codon:yes gene_type:complete
MPTLDACSIDTNNLFFGVARREKNGQLIVPISTDAHSFSYATRLRFQLGQDQHRMLQSPFGFNALMEGQPKDTPRRNMDLTPTPELEAKLNELDRWVNENASARSQDFFKTVTLNKQHVPTVRILQNGTKIVRVKVPVGTNAADVSTIEPNGVVRPADWTKLGRGLKVIAIVDTPGIWHNPTQFGISLTARQLLIEETAVAAGLSAFNLAPGLVEEALTEDGEMMFA